MLLNTYRDTSKTVQNAFSGILIALMLLSALVVCVHRYRRWNKRERHKTKVRQYSSHTDIDAEDDVDHRTSTDSVVPLPDHVKLEYSQTPVSSIAMRSVQLHRNRDSDSNSNSSDSNKIIMNHDSSFNEQSNSAPMITNNTNRQICSNNSDGDTSRETPFHNAVEISDV